MCVVDSVRKLIPENYLGLLRQHLIKIALAECDSIAYKSNDASADSRISAEATP
jgi:hypothetical protein